jgi:hypothetical protein
MVQARAQTSADENEEHAVIYYLYFASQKPAALNTRERDLQEVGATVKS